MDKKDKLPESFLKGSPWKDFDEGIWPNTSFLLQRNLSSYHFPSKISMREAKEVLNRIQKTLKAEIKESYCFSLATILPHHKELISEHFILSIPLEKAEDHRMIVIDESGSFLALINFDNHLGLHFSTSSQNLKKHYEEIILPFEKTLSKQLSFAFSERFGYLTSDPGASGTALTVQAFVHVPALIYSERFLDFIDTLSHDVILHALGSDGKYIADLVMIENTYKLGVTEEFIFNSVSKAATLFVQEEKKARNELQKSPSLLLKDKIAKAYSLLSHSYLLSMQEAFSALSLIELGMSLGLLQTKESFSFFDLFFSCRRAHLLEDEKDFTLSKEALSQRRALKLRASMQSIDISSLY